jgi:hypothetical protein
VAGERYVDTSATESRRRASSGYAVEVEGALHEIDETQVGDCIHIEVTAQRYWYVRVEVLKWRNVMAYGVNGCYSRETMS